MVSTAEKGKGKGLSKGKMTSIKQQVLQTVAEVEAILGTLSAEGADYEGGYAFIEDNLRVLADALGKFEKYDEKNCVIWTSLANIVIDTLEKAKKQYDGFAAQNKIPSSLVGIKEYMDLGEQEIQKLSKKTGCAINRSI